MSLSRDKQYLGGLAVRSAAVLLVLVGLAGCTEQRRIDARLAERRAEMDSVLSYAARCDAERGVKLKAWSATIDKSLRTDAVKLDRTSHELNRLAAKDAQRWEGRQPEYRREGDKWIRRNPEQIERTAVDLFY